MPNPDCPQCGGNRTYETEAGRWRCHQCDAYFEPDDEADYYTDPTRRIQREEARTQRRREKLRRNR